MKNRRGIVAVAALLALGLLVYVAFPGLLLQAAIGWERRVAGLSEKRVQVDGDTIAFLEREGSGPVLLLVHGFGADKDNWTRFARHLPAQYRLVAPDLPGFGESTRDETKRYDVISQVRRLRRFTEVLGLGRLHLAGNSMGGQISAVYAAEYPEQVASLGLFAPGGLRSPRPSEMARRLAAGEVLPLLVSSRADFDRMLGLVFVQIPAAPGVLLDHLAARAVRNRAFNEKVWKDLWSPPRPLERDLGRIRARTLVLWGDSDRVLDVSGVEVLDLLLPAPPVTVILGSCGHAPMIERPAETADHYGRFLGSAGG